MFNLKCIDAWLGKLPKGLIDLTLSRLTEITGEGFKYLPEGLKSLELINFTQMIKGEYLKEVPENIRRMPLDGLRIDDPRTIHELRERGIIVDTALR